MAGQSDQERKVMRLERQLRPGWEGLEATKRTLAFLMKETGASGGF